MATTFQNIDLETRKKASYITINRPRSRNALDSKTIEELCEAVEHANADPETRCIVITGSGDKAFSAGVDLVELGASADRAVKHHALGRLTGLFQSLWDGDKPTIARVDGWCLAGGFGLALACDMVVASDRSSFGAPEVRHGLWPYIISLPMVRAMGPRRALESMLTGDNIDATTGRDLGFITAVVSQENLDHVVNEYIDKISAGSAQGIALGRKAFYSIIDNDPSARLRSLHAHLTAHLSLVSDATTGLAEFAEKR